MHVKVFSNPLESCSKDVNVMIQGASHVLHEERHTLLTAGNVHGHPNQQVSSDSWVPLWAPLLCTGGQVQGALKKGGPRDVQIAQEGFHSVGEHLRGTCQEGDLYIVGDGAAFNAPMSYDSSG